jgi:hypothetical protein
VAVLSPPYALGATGQLLSGRLLRLSLGATFRPAAAGVLAAAAGALYGPPGTMGEATLVNPTTLRIAPARWVVQGSRSADQGQYVVPNDGNVDLAVTAQHASQFRRSLWMVTVADSQAAGVASSATTDRALLQIVDGPLSATSPAPLPTVPADSLVLGEVGIPPVGQTVTITPYNPRTTGRGGIMPVSADALTYPGHGAEAPAHDGQARWHPTQGLQLAAGGTWGAPSPPFGRSWEGDYGTAVGVPSIANATQPAVPWATTNVANDAIRKEAGDTVFTILEDGVYAIAASFRFTAGGTVNGERFLVLVATSGTSAQTGTALLAGAALLTSGSVFAPPGGVATPVCVLPGRRFTAGQQFQVQVFQNSGATLTGHTANWSRLHVTRIR